MMSNDVTESSKRCVKSLSLIFIIICLTVKYIPCFFEFFSGVPGFSDPTFRIFYAFWVLEFCFLGFSFRAFRVSVFRRSGVPGFLRSSVPTFQRSSLQCWPLSGPVGSLYTNLQRTVF